MLSTAWMVRTRNPRARSAGGTGGFRISLMTRSLLQPGREQVRESALLSTDSSTQVPRKVDCVRDSTLERGLERNICGGSCPIELASHDCCIYISDRRHVSWEGETSLTVMRDSKKGKHFAPSVCSTSRSDLRKQTFKTQLRKNIFQRAEITICPSFHFLLIGLIASVRVC